MRVAVDFDGTCVCHKYPEVGESVPGAVKTLKKLVAHGHELVLYTMRRDDPHDILKGTEHEHKADFLTDAHNWFIENEIPVTVHTEWHKPPVDIFIDDLSIGAPLIYEEGKHPYINWREAEEEFLLRGFFEKVVSFNFSAKFVSEYQTVKFDHSISLPVELANSGVTKEHYARMAAVLELENRIFNGQSVDDYDECIITFHK